MPMIIHLVTDYSLYRDEFIRRSFLVEWIEQHNQANPTSKCKHNHEESSASIFLLSSL